MSPQKNVRVAVNALGVEECGEVIQAATKCLRFGWDRLEPDYGVNNLVLAQELGDLLGIMDALNFDASAIDRMSNARRNKLARALRAKRVRVRG